MFFNSIIFNLSAFAETKADQDAKVDDWELQYSKDGIEVFTKVVEGAQIKAFKAKTVVDAPLQSVMSVMGDTAHYPDWFHLCASYEFVKGPSTNGEYISYYVVSAPWPLKDRDIYVKNLISQDPDTLTVTIIASGVPDYGPVKDDYTRVPEVSAHWTFKPVGENKTFIELIGHGYPGGVIPVWIANMVVTDVPKKTFQNLHKVTTESRYDLAHVVQQDPVFPNLQYPKVRVGLN